MVKQQSVQPEEEARKHQLRSKSADNIGDQEQTTAYFSKTSFYGHHRWPEAAGTSQLRQQSLISLQNIHGKSYLQRVLARVDQQVDTRRTIIQRQANLDTTEDEATGESAELSQAEIDAIVSQEILNVLNNYQNIPIEITGTQTQPEGEVGPPAPINMTVFVTAAYFINTATARTHYGDRRSRSRFSAIVRSLRGEVGVIERSSGGRLTAGQAVRFGKASPGDIKKFVEEALSQDVIRRYARRRRRISRGQQLTDLAQDEIQEVIQDWINHVGVGVDCTGFAQVAAIRAREAVRDQLRSAGVPEESLPPELEHGQRPNYGQEVTDPSSLRPGHIWRTNNGQHVRIVMQVFGSPESDGSEAIEFETAESSGGSTSTAPGPVRRRWLTSSRSEFHPITRVDHDRGTVDGSFYQIQEP